MRIGIDVGGTNTDAVLIDGEDIVASCKTATTDEITDGIETALKHLVNSNSASSEEVDAVMIGTTHFVNAVVQRRHLNKVATIRIGLPASASLYPMIDWPDDLRNLVNGNVYMVEGGHEYDGRPLMPLDEAELVKVAGEISASGVTAVAISSIFSPLTDSCEKRAREILLDENPKLKISESNKFGRIGLLERESVTILNACLQDISEHTVNAFEEALNRSGLTAPLFITQNDGTVTKSEFARKTPVFAFASGPTNSMRGAAFLSGIENAMVVDIGGTTSDVGCIRNGYPREANNVIEIGGVRTLFRMPDVVSIGIGGGTIVKSDPLEIGPESVGNRLHQAARVFGGDQLTLTDIAVASGKLDLGEAGLVNELPEQKISDIINAVNKALENTVDSMKTDSAATPLLVVGGGAMLCPREMEGISEVVNVMHADVANAVGAAMAQISGEVDRVFHNMSRDDLLLEAKQIATQRAVSAGAKESTVRVVDVEDLPLAYMPGNAVRARVRVVGDIGD